MPITTSDILGSDQVGIYLAVCGNVVFHPRGTQRGSIEQNR